MIGVEMVSNPETREPLDSNLFIDIWESCKDMGVLLGKGGINGNVSVNFYRVILHF
jgi:alanine-glyoxylate transaminase/(R)-3-amino-2-methylpropionate-pyruvate transaminase